MGTSLCRSAIIGTKDLADAAVAQKLLDAGSGRVVGVIGGRNVGVGRLPGREVKTTRRIKKRVLTLHWKRRRFIVLRRGAGEWRDEFVPPAAGAKDGWSGVEALADHP